MLCGLCPRHHGKSQRGVASLQIQHHPHHSLANSLRWSGWGFSVCPFLVILSHDESFCLEQLMWTELAVSAGSQGGQRIYMALHVTICVCRSLTSKTLKKQSSPHWMCSLRSSHQVEKSPRPSLSLFLPPGNNQELATVVWKLFIFYIVHHLPAAHHIVSERLTAPREGGSTTVPALRTGS